MSDPSLIRHRDESWAKEIMLRDYGREIYEKMEDRVIRQRGNDGGES